MGRRNKPPSPTLALKAVTYALIGFGVGMAAFLWVGWWLWQKVVMM